MQYLMGYIVACFSVVAGLGAGISSLHRKSSFRSTSRVPKSAPLIKSRALISFYIILPFSALAFLILTFAAMRISQSQGQQGHLFYVLTSLFLPTASFLVGYYYFRKAVRS